MGRIFWALIISAGCGFLSLSMEILWVRMMHWTSFDRPSTFAYVLGFFLTGIASGAYIGKSLTERFTESTWFMVSIAFYVTGTLLYLFLPIISRIYTISSSFGSISAYTFILLICMILGIIFPLLCHASISNSDRFSIRLSWIYAANIVGSTLGPIITGFFLLDYLELGRCFQLISLALLALSLFTLVISGNIKKRMIPIGTGLVFISSVLILLSFNPFYNGILEKLLFKESVETSPSFKYEVENRSGIIAVSPDFQGGHDVLYGGGLYDGRFNIHPVIGNDNGIDRAYMAVCLHRGDPKKVLMIGLGSGSWARVVANYSAVKDLTVVEINPGYEKIIRHYPGFSNIFRNKKVRIVWDDGRRWLLSHPEIRFDLIVMNTSFNWRSHATHILSKQFLRLCQKHLNDEGLFLFNATSSIKVAVTAAQVFKYAYSYSNAIVASDRPIDTSPKKRLGCFLEFRDHQGRAMFDTGDPVILNGLKNLSTSRILNISTLRKGVGVEPITDDSMSTEFPGWTDPEKSLSKYLSIEDSG